MIELTDDEWYGNMEPGNGLVLQELDLENFIISYHLIDACNNIPYIAIYKSKRDDRFNIVQKFRINLLTQKQYGYRDETDIEPVAIEYLDWLIHSTSEFLGNEIFYEPYMKDKKPSEIGIFDFSKPIWYNIIYWINYNYEEQIIDPNTPIPNLSKLIKRS
jgi:hypothetical protein